MQVGIQGPTPKHYLKEWGYRVNHRGCLPYFHLSEREPVHARKPDNPEYVDEQTIPCRRQMSRLTDGAISQIIDE